MEIRIMASSSNDSVLRKSKTRVFKGLSTLKIHLRLL